MANAKVPLKFQVFRGAEFIREDVVSEPVIKVGKLASSHLRLEDDSVSRMHAVIEINGAEDVQLIDLGSTRGTLVNGEKVTKTRLRSGDQISFGDIRVIVTFLEAEESTFVAPHIAAAAAAQPAARGQMPSTLVLPQSPAPAPPVPPPAVSPATVSAGYSPPGAAPPVAPPPGYSPAPSFPAAPAYPPPSAAYQASPPAAGAQFAVPAASSPVAAEVESPDGSRAVEVQALYRGVVINTRHLADPLAKATSTQAKSMITAGAGLFALAMGLFVYTVLDVGAEKAAFEASGQENQAFQWKSRSDVLAVGVFGGWALGVSLIYMGLKRRGKKNNNYVIGSIPEADAPAGAEFVGGPAFSLVNATGADFAVNVTPQMTGEVVVDGQVLPLQQWVQQRGPSFQLPERGRARILCGESTFLVSSTPKPRTLEVPFLLWDPKFMGYMGGAVVTLGLFLLTIFAVPPDPKSLSLDLFNSDNRFLNFLIKPPEEKEEEIPEWLKKKGPDEQGGKGKRHKGEEGKMGKKTSKNKEGLYGLKGPKDNPDPHLAKKLAEEAVKNAGILGLLKMNEGSHIASVFGRDTALGSDAENVLGGLIGSTIGEAYGVGGLGLLGTGSGGGGTGEGTIGLGNLGTIGKGGGGGSGSGYGRGAGGLGGRRAKTPDVLPGQAAVRGSLDKEIIRRIIRRHINEVKYCYEQELTRKPDLGGRIAVQFTIAATGSVVASVLQQSTMGNARVENCVVQAVRRWEFPKPLGGGIVLVTYPFNFNPAGGASE